MTLIIVVIMRKTTAVGSQAIKTFSDVRYTTLMAINLWKQQRSDVESDIGQSRINVPHASSL